MGRIRFFSLLFTLLIFAPFVCGLGASNAEFGAVEQGETYSLTVFVYTGAGETQNHFIITEECGNISDWISVSPTELDLEGTQTERVEVTLTVPRDAPLGKRECGLKVSGQKIVGGSDTVGFKVSARSKLILDVIPPQKQSSDDIIASISKLIFDKPLRIAQLLEIDMLTLLIIIALLIVAFVGIRRMRTKMDRKFKLQKTTSLEVLEAASARGEVSDKLAPLLDYINSLPNMYTTSSYVGRIAITVDKMPQAEGDGELLGEWRDTVKFEDIKATLARIPPRGMVWLRQEPISISITARNVKDILILLSSAQPKSLKVNLTSYQKDRVQVEVCGTDQLSIPIAAEGKVIIPDEYLKYIVDLVNNNLKAEQKKLKKLHKNLMGL